MQAIHNMCCFGPPHWKEQCWAGFLPGLETFEKKVLLRVPLFTKAATQAAASYPPQLCVDFADFWLDAMTRRDAKFKCARLKRVHGSAWIESASIKRICVSAAQVKERRQGSRKRAPLWWLAAAKSDFVPGSRLGIISAPFMGLHRHSAQRRQGCVWTHPFLWASRFQGPPLELVEKVRRAIRKEFALEPVVMPKPSFGLPSNVRVDILCGVMRVAGDPDANTLQDWLVQGAPLRMDRRMETTGVFPPADKPDKEDHSPTPDVSEQLTVGWEHYRSVPENPVDAHKEYERYRAAQIAVDIDKDTLECLFPKGHVNKSGLIIKESLVPIFSSVSSSNVTSLSTSS